MDRTGQMQWFFIYSAFSSSLLFSLRHCALWSAPPSPHDSTDLVVLGLLIVEVSRWLSHNAFGGDVPERAIRPSQRPLPHNTQHSHETYPCPPGGFEPAIPTSKIPQSHALHRVATWIDQRPVTAHNIETNRSWWPCRLSSMSATA